MYLAVQKDSFQPNVEVCDILESLAQFSNNLDNECTYLSRQYFFENDRKPWRVLSYPKLYAAKKNSENSLSLFSQVAQQTMKSANEAFKSFKSLHKLWRACELEKEPKLPRYRKKGGLYQIVYPGQHLKEVDGRLRIPLGRCGAKQFGMDCFWISKPERLKDVQIRELRLIPIQGKWEVEFVYESIETPALSCRLHPYRVLGLDPGLNNLLTGVTNTGESFILDGRWFKARNQFYNKRVAKLKSILTQGKTSTRGVTSRQLQRHHLKRRNQSRDFINKAARYVIAYSQVHEIDTVVYGHNKRQKDSSPLSKKVNQEFVQIPHHKLLNRIQQLCWMHGIRFVDTEESYTSKASFFDDDVLPTHGEKPPEWKPSGKRIKRGLYRTGQGWMLNADCNGAANIIRKVSTKLGINLSGVSRGAVAAPSKVKLSPAGFSVV